jgi:hypothetical protein
MLGLLLPSQLLFPLTLPSPQVGPDWFCMLFTYCLIIIPSLLFIIYIADVISIILTILSSLSLAVLLACYSYAACSDPGIVWKDTYMIDPEAEGISSAKIGMIECSQCQMMRPCTAMHCYDCGVCVEDVSTLLPHLFHLLFPHCLLPSHLLCPSPVGSPLPLDREVYRQENHPSLLLVPHDPHPPSSLCWWGLSLLHLLPLITLSIFPHESSPHCNSHTVSRMRCVSPRFTFLCCMKLLHPTVPPSPPKSTYATLHHDI